LGIASKNDFEKNLTIESYPFEVGDQILLYTDGIVEARNHDNEEFGYEKLSDWFLKNQTLQGSTAEKLLSDILNWTQKQVPEDDFSVLSIKRIS
jgi:serine phosphatase RsbU (regulator of sigma subunit)